MNPFFTPIRWAPDRCSNKSENGWKWLQRRGSSRTIRDSTKLLDTARTTKMARVEAALFVADGALSLSKLAKTATLENVTEARELIDQLNLLYEADGTAFRIERVATGVQMLTRPAFAVWLDKIHNRQANLKLSAPAMETLAIIAYRQPCTRADVEVVRGVQSAEMIKQLMERNLVRITGEDDSLGRPYLYGTTKLFLESFGVQDLNNLPMADKLIKSKPEIVQQEVRGKEA